jgi:hypothetical protein
MSARALRTKGVAHRYLGRRLGLVAGLALALPGCPFSDEYYVDPALGRSGSASGVGASSGRGGGPLPAGGKSGNTGGAGKGALDGKSGIGGKSAPGGKGGLAGSSSAGTGGTAGDIGAGGAACEPEAEVCDGISNDCDDEIDEDGVCPTGCTARLYEGRTYLLCLPAPADRLQHLAAGYKCADFGQQAGLAVPTDLEYVAIQSQEENDFVKRWLAEATTESGLVWMGATDVREESIWVWGRGLDVEVQFFTGNGSGGTPYMGAYNDFASGEPHGATAADGIDCGAFDSNEGWQWVDTDCLQAGMGFVCESP